MRVSSIKLFVSIVFIGAVFTSSAQSLFVVPKATRLPQDSIARLQLISSLNGLLAQKENNNSSNTYVLKEALPETSVLLDEMKGLEKSSALKNDHFYQCYLTDVTPVGKGRYLLQISWMGVTEGEPMLRASFRLGALEQGGKFYFYSPLKQNTAGWKTKQLGYITFHYRDTMDKAIARDYLNTVTLYDRKLNATSQPIQYYYCDNFSAVQQALGLDYKQDYNGYTNDGLSAHEDNTGLVVDVRNDAQYHFDPHDLWHERLRQVMDRAIINKPVDEGCAYLYGGSWGIGWPAILADFKKYARENPNADWLAIYTSDKNKAFGSVRGRPFIISDAINALIVQKTEHEKGFAPVIQLLGCGPVQTGDDNYFAALEKATGIGKKNFNIRVWELINNSK